MKPLRDKIPLLDDDDAAIPLLDDDDAAIPLLKMKEDLDDDSAEIDDTSGGRSGVGTGPAEARAEVGLRAGIRGSSTEPGPEEAGYTVVRTDTTEQGSYVGKLIQFFRGAGLRTGARAAATQPWSEGADCTFVTEPESDVGFRATETKPGSVGVTKPGSVWVAEPGSAAAGVAKPGSAAAGMAKLGSAAEGSLLVAEPGSAVGVAEQGSAAGVAKPGSMVWVFKPGGGGLEEPGSWSMAEQGSTAGVAEQGSAAGVAEPRSMVWVAKPGGSAEWLEEPGSSSMAEQGSTAGVAKQGSAAVVAEPGPEASSRVEEPTTKPGSEGVVAEPGSEASSRVEEPTTKPGSEGVGCSKVRTEGPKTQAKVGVHPESVPVPDEVEAFMIELLTSQALDRLQGHKLTRRSRLIILIRLSVLLGVITPLVLFFSRSEPLLMVWRLSLMISSCAFFWTNFLMRTMGRRALFLYTSYWSLVAFFAHHALGPAIGVIIIHLNSHFAAGLLGYALAEHRQFQGMERSFLNVRVPIDDEDLTKLRVQNFIGGVVLSGPMMGLAGGLGWLVWHSADYGAAELVLILLILLIAALILGIMVVVVFWLRGAFTTPDSFAFLLLYFAVIAFSWVFFPEVFGDLIGMIVTWFVVLPLSGFFGYCVCVHVSYKQLIKKGNSNKIGI